MGLVVRATEQTPAEAGASFALDASSPELRDVVRRFIM
ncbi:hypothetical protein J2S57_001459 [Kineosporia succinea]|uniref:Uncharacterized protein n=1 Tax=Kineosporia succinea TaxID=84632 RepID=A0ABT9P0S9_9ACTN|nr:hypothetical protein [Kineosporia succinea]